MRSNLVFTLEDTTKNITKSKTLKLEKPSKSWNGSQNKNPFLTKKRFSAAELTFSTVVLNVNKQRPLDSKIVRGRLPNKVCDFLLPLLRSELITIEGNIAYDIGAVKKFQDVLIELSIFVDKNFFHLIEHHHLDYRKADADNIEVECLHNLLLWLSGGEIECIVDNKAKQNSSSVLLDTKPSPMQHETEYFPDNDQEQQTMSVDEIIEPSTVASTLSLESLTLPLPLLAEDVTLKPYQVEAVKWMIKRETIEKDTELTPAETTVNRISALSSDSTGFIEEKNPSKMIIIDENEDKSTSLWTQIIAVKLDNTIQSHLIGDKIKALCPSPENIIVFWWNRFSRLLSLQPPKPPQPCRGGILAHDMGMGTYD